MLTLTLQGENALELPPALGLADDAAKTAEYPWGKTKLFILKSEPDFCKVAVFLELEELLTRKRVAFNPPIAQHVHAGRYLASVLVTQALADLFKLFQPETELPALHGNFEVGISAIALTDGGTLAKKWLNAMDYEMAIEGHAPIVSLTIKGKKQLSELLLETAILIPALDRDSEIWWEPANAASFANLAASKLTSHPYANEILAAIQKHSKTQALPNLLHLQPFWAPIGKGSLSLPVHELDKEVQLAQAKIILNQLKASKKTTLLYFGIPITESVRDILDIEGLTSFGITDLETTQLQAFAQDLNSLNLDQKAGNQLRLYPSSPVFKNSTYDAYSTFALPFINRTFRKFQLPALESSLFKHMAPEVLWVSGDNTAFGGASSKSKKKRDAETIRWNTKQARTWAEGTASKHGYELAFQSFGPEDEDQNQTAWLATFHKGIHR